MDPSKTCTTCAWADWDQYECRRFPPARMPTNYAHDGLSWFPNIQPTDWCGEHQLPDPPGEPISGNRR